MIEIVDSVFIKRNGQTLCVVRPVLVDDPEWPNGKPDVYATQLRAEHIVNALRHYEVSQEVERVL